MHKANQYYDGSVHVKINGEEYDIDLHATAYYHYTPGTMYRRNGDPGDPPETEFEIEYIEIEFIFNENGDDVTSKYDEDEKFKALIDDAVNEALQNENFENIEPDCYE